MHVHLRLIDERHHFQHLHSLHRYEATLWHHHWVGHGRETRSRLLDFRLSVGVLHIVRNHGQSGNADRETESWGEIVVSFALLAGHTHGLDLGLVLEPDLGGVGVEGVLGLGVPALVGQIVLGLDFLDVAVEGRFSDADLVGARLDVG